MNDAFAGNTHAYALYRAQRAVVADNSAVNGANLAAGAAYAQMSTKPASAPLYFNNPTDLQTPGNRGIDINNLTASNDALLLHDVLSFDVRIMPVNYQQISKTTEYFSDIGDFDSSNGGRAIFN